MFNQLATIQGVFKFDVFDASGNKKADSIYKKNFITPTGLTFPSFFAFADCFRFVSVGTGTGASYITGLGTTGLISGIPNWSYIGSRTNYYDPTTSQYEAQACGYREQGASLTLTRGWRIPTGNLSFDQDYTFTEFMVSPGRPYVTGTNSTSTTYACSCNDSVSDGNGNTLYGLDCANIADYYRTPRLCDVPYAFARVLQEIQVAQSDFLVVSYELTISYNTGVHIFNTSIQNSVGGGNWNGALSGYAGIVHHGLKLINNGNNPPNNGPDGARTQIPNFSFSNDYGESYVPPWGAPIEPTCTETKLAAYLSTDNLQFLINSVSGGKLSTLPLNYSSGLMGWRQTPSQDVQSTFNTRWYNIRTDGTQTFYPEDTDITQETNASSLSSPFNVSYMEGSRWSRSALNTVPYVASGRSRTGSYSWQFWGRNATLSGFANLPVRALVMSYKDGSSLTPFYDVIFSENNGNVLPYIDWVGHTYSLPDSNYNYMEDGANLTLTFNMSWSSPCDPSVIGC